MAKVKKDFTDTAAARMFDAIEQATAEDKKEYKTRREYDTQEAQEARNKQQTAGRKGLKQQRINMAFSDDNYDFIQVMAKVRGQTLTAFVNDIISKAREENADIYRQAILFRKAL